ncbi:MAG TPA: AAA family ATPase [Longimicrobium sp.]|jgi:tetratricopeptide (TPR) repeat protein
MINLLPGSEDELSECLWEEFETFALSVLCRYYGIHDVMVQGRQATGDGGRDGDAVYVIAKEQSSVNSKLWVEIKKRTSAHLDIDDVGGHVVMAYVSDVNRLIFVTNGRFTDLLRCAIEDFAYRAGLDCTLMTGAELLDVARRTGGVSKPQTRSLDDTPGADPPGTAGNAAVQGGDSMVLEVRASFSTRIDRPQSGLEEAELKVQPGTPLYLIVDTAVVQCCGQQEVELSTACRTDGMSMAFQPGRPAGAVGLGDRFRSVHALFIQRPGLYSADDFLIRAQLGSGGAEVRVNVLPGGRLRVLPPLLADWLPPSRQPAEEEAGRALRRFLSGAPFESVGLIAPAGTGKTHLVQRLRRLWINHGVHEVLLDGSLENRDQELALAILRCLVPVQPDVFRLDEVAVETMLSRLGVPAPLARRGAELLSAGAGSGLRASVRELGQLLALVLAARSEKQPIAVILEDLHKVYASALALLQELLDGLRRLGKGRVMVVFTSRDVPDTREQGLAAIWEGHIRELCGEQTTVVKLPSLDPSEAAQLLRASVPTLEAHQAASIIEQVGRTPFALREALALLRERGDLVYEDLLSQHVLVRPEGLQEALDAHRLRAPTLHRLEILRGRLSPAAWELLEAAACLGKFFDVEAAALSSAGLAEAYAAVEAFQRLEILTARGLRASQASFDHDLIRRGVLEQMGAVRQRRIAGQLYQRTGQSAAPGLAASLAYQAGLAEECYEHARALAREVGRRGRAADAASALGMAITVVDDNTAQKVVNLSPRARGNIDDAVAVAPLCTMAGWTTSRRQQELLALLMEYIQYLADVTGSGSQLLDAALTEAEMLAVVRRDLFRRAQLVGYRGRQDFVVDRYESSVGWHRRADEMLRQVPDAPVVQAERAENLIRLAISLRQLTLRDESRAMLREALRLRSRSGWALLLKVLANWGATYFQSDWTLVRRFWERAERVAERRQRPDRLVHSLIDVAHLDLLEECHDAAHERLLRAEALAEDHGYENSLLRVHLNLGCLHMVQGEYATARHHLLKAEELGMANRVPRRLWRARANLATLYEAMGEFAQAYAWDAAMLSTFELLPDAPGMTERERQASLGNSRKGLALANLVMRSDESPVHAQLVESLGDLARQVGTDVAHRVRCGVELPGLRDRHCKEIASRRRFIITE